VREQRRTPSTRTVFTPSTRRDAGTKDYRVHVLAKGEEDMTVAELSLWHDVPLVAEGGLQCGNQPARRVYWHRVDGVEVDAAIQDEHAVKF
jgi:hypothetical protein